LRRGVAGGKLWVALSPFGAALSHVAEVGPMSLSLLSKSIFFSSLVLAGCTGTLDVWGLNVPLPVDDDDDDEPTPGIDFSEYWGIEYLNIRWDPEQAEVGLVDCQEEFEVSGEQVRDHDGCASCDVIWAVALEMKNEDEPCLSQGTDLDLAPEFDRFLGMDFHPEGQFTLYRSTADSGDDLLALGRGAFDGLAFTWSGLGDWEYHFAAEGFTLFYSGEGDF